MNGATALLWAKTRSKPSRTSTIAIGASQYFFSCFKKSQNSPSTDRRAMVTSVQVIEMFRIPQAGGRGLPRRRGRAPGSAKAGAPRPPLGGAIRRGDHREEERQQGAAGYPTEGPPGAPPPPR